MDDSKESSSSLRSLTHGTSHSAHRDLEAGPSSSSSSSTPFRQQRQWPGPNGGTDEDFGRFAAYQPELGGVADWTTPQTYSNQAQSGRGTAARDGEDIQALLTGSTSLAEAVYGDWQTELEQSHSTKHERDSTMPRDPQTSLHAAGNKGKTRSEQGMTDEEMELVASVSSLELVDREYLRSLLAQPESSALDMYLGQGTYTEDVYGLNPAVQRVLDQAKKGTEQTSEGRAQAVRRLAMVLRHLDGYE
ncbi:hypothetical protein ACM66B_002806 [Microbotryomycetes sp. NB124-2]